MTAASRQRRHESNVARIDQVQQVCGLAGHSRIDHEATLLERARLLEEELDSHTATEEGLAALDRLLIRAEYRSTAQTGAIVEFIGAVWNERPLDLRLLRTLDAQTAADAIAVLDAFRHARVHLPTEVAGGAARIARLMKRAPTAPAETH